MKKREKWLSSEWLLARIGVDRAAAYVLENLRVHEVDPATLADLKRALRGFDAQRKVWGKRARRPKVVPMTYTQEVVASVERERERDA